MLAAEGCGVFRFDGDSGPALSHLAGRRPDHVRIDKPPGKAALLATLAATLHFPDYFGGNWDALHDCLTELERAKVPGLVIEIRGLGRFAREAPQELLTAIQTFVDAAHFWSERRGRFVVLLGGAGKLADSLPPLAG